VAKRSPSYAKRALKAEWLRFIRSMRKELTQVVALIAVVCLFELLLNTPRLIAGLLVGFLVTACAAMIGFAFLLSGDAAYLIAGALGEAHTAEELEAARKAGSIWSYVANVEASGRDVDHVVLTPSGVIAVETKWRFKGATEAWLRESAVKAESAARQARLVLQSKTIDVRLEVRPLVVVWGGARREIPDHQIVDGVAVIRGDHLLQWLTGRATGRLAQDHAAALQSKLEAFAASHRAA
jgi:hypothetical protein